MTVDAGLVTWLIVGSLLLATLAVVLDRVNFPQKPFRPKRIETGTRGAARDRTGAHIIDVDDVDDEADGASGAEAGGAERAGGAARGAGAGGAERAGGAARGAGAGGAGANGPAGGAGAGGANGVPGGV